MMKRFYFTLLVLAVILLALPGLTAKGASGIRRYPRRFVRRLSASPTSVPAGRLGS
jgi:hypothetical protein